MPAALISLRKPRFALGDRLQQAGFACIETVNNNDTRQLKVPHKPLFDPAVSKVSVKVSIRAVLQLSGYGTRNKEFRAFACCLLRRRGLRSESPGGFGCSKHGTSYRFGLPCNTAASIILLSCNCKRKPCRLSSCVQYSIGSCTEYISHLRQEVNPNTSPETQGLLFQTFQYRAVPDQTRA